MKNKEGQPMTREEANVLFEQAMRNLAEHSVINSRLSRYIDQLDIYMHELDEKEKAEKETEEGSTNE